MNTRKIEVMESRKAFVKRVKEKGLLYAFDYAFLRPLRNEWKVNPKRAGLEFFGNIAIMLTIVGCVMWVNNEISYCQITNHEDGVMYDIPYDEAIEKWKDYIKFRNSEAIEPNFDTGSLCESGLIDNSYCLKGVVKVKEQREYFKGLYCGYDVKRWLDKADVGKNFVKVEV